MHPTTITAIFLSAMLANANPFYQSSTDRRRQDPNDIPDSVPLDQDTTESDTTIPDIPFNATIPGLVNQTVIDSNTTVPDLLNQTTVDLNTTVPDLLNQTTVNLNTTIPDLLNQTTINFNTSIIPDLSNQTIINVNATIPNLLNQTTIDTNTTVPGLSNDTTIIFNGTIPDPSPEAPVDSIPELTDPMTPLNAPVAAIKSRQLQPSNATDIGPPQRAKFETMRSKLTDRRSRTPVSTRPRQI